MPLDFSKLMTSATIYATVDGYLTFSPVDESGNPLEVAGMLTSMSVEVDAGFSTQFRKINLNILETGNEWAATPPYHPPANAQVPQTTTDAPKNIEEEADDSTTHPHHFLDID